MTRVATSAFAGWRESLCALLAMFTVGVSPAGAQNVTEASLETAFVFNFAVFTEWPQGLVPQAGSLVACVLGDDHLADALDRAVEGRHVSGHPVTVMRVTVDGPLRSCHVLYVSGLSALQIGAALALVRDAPVLTVSDTDDFAQRGGIAHLFVDKGRMRFDINLGLARRCRLHLSSKMLALAARLLDGPGASPP
jgi:hypothetical protein